MAKKRGIWLVKVEIVKIRVIKMGSYLEFGTGYGTGENSMEAGRAAAETACKTLRKYEPNLVLVFSSPKHDLKQVLKGIRQIVGRALLIGGTTPGGLCHGFRPGGVVVSVFASPYLSIRVGVGSNLSLDYRRAVQEAIDTSGTGEYFDEIQPRAEKPELDLDYAKKKFALLFLPGPTADRGVYNYEVVNLIRQRSFNAFPLVGGCTAKEAGCRADYQIVNDQVLTDSLVLALVETHLKFGVASSLNQLPSGIQALITKVDGYEIKELGHQPAAEFYAGLIKVNPSDLSGEPSRFFLANPLGVCDEFGNYSVLMGIQVTPEQGIRCLRKPALNSTVSIMKPGREKLKFSMEEVVVKAASRGRISKPSVCIVFSSLYNWEHLGPEAINRTVREVKSRLRHSNLHPEYTGFISGGETGVNDEGISVYLDYAVSCLMIADELNSASTVAFKNKILYDELSDTAIRNQVLYEELAAVHEMSNFLNSSLDLKFVINKAVEMVGKFFQADGCGLFIYDEQTDTFKMSGFYDQKEAPKKIDWKKTLPYFALMEKRPVIANDIHGNKLVSAEFNRFTRAKAIIAAPIIIKEEKVGVISAYSRQPHFFNKSDLEFLQTLSNQVGTAIVNARLFEQTQLLACTDGLTGLYDHNYFLKALSRLITTATKKKQNLSLIMVDLDDFKYCNDKYGHTVGDIILKETAEILKRNVRNNDIIARYGGDEFVVILVNAAKERAFQIAERIRRKISLASFEDPDRDSTFGITASIGIATFPDDATTAKHLINRADKAMYRIKRHVKNKSQLYFSDFAVLEKEFTASEKAFFDTIKILIQILDSKDRYTWEHSRQVAYYAVQLAESLGLSEEEKHWLRLTGYLHDIGKIHISSEIMNKKGRLNPDEYSVVMLHPIVGANLLAPIKGFKKMIPIIYHHHEWFDGSGYPDGLSGYDIPKGARILAVIDGFDAMTSNRPYRKAQATEWALEELIHQKGLQYDPQLVDAFVKLIRRELAKEGQKNRRQTDRLNHEKERRAGKEPVKESN